MYNGIRFTKPGEVEMIVETAFRILEEIGVCIENDELTALIREKFSGNAFWKNGRLCFPSALSREIFSSGKGKQPPEMPTAVCRGEVYEGYYLDPMDNQYKEWDENRLLSYVSLAKQLPHVDGIHMLGCPLNQTDLSLKPLYEKLYCFQYGIGCGGAIWDTELCGPLLEIFSIYAAEKEKTVQEVFSGCVYLLTPLKLGHVEAEQLMWFYHRGIRVGVGILASLGLSVPVTIAGGLAEHIAEQLFIGIINKALFDENTFALESMLSCVDMRNGSFQYGRPEQVLMNNALSDIAELYGMRFAAHGGLTDAKVPGYEAAVQKIGTALSNLSKGRPGYLAGGLLSVDEVCSPVQLVLDHEATGYLKRICSGFEIDQESLALEAVRDCVENDLMFIASEHTLSFWRDSIWMPELFSYQMFHDWSQHGKTAVDLAREKAIALSQKPLEKEISEDCENRIHRVIREEEARRRR